MKQNIEIWVCSNAALDYVDHSPEIKILRSTITFGSSTDVYEDYIDMDAQTFYQKIAQDPEDIPRTAYVSRGIIDELLNDAKSRGVTDIIAILISSNLSGLYSAMETFANEYSDDTIKVHPFDSKTLVYAEAYMALTAYEMAQENKSIPEIFKRLEYIRDHNHIFFAVDTLKYLVLNGRLSKSSAMIGNFLKIKPLLHLDDGKVVPLEKARTTKGAVAKVIERYVEATTHKNVLTYISHADNPTEASHIQAEILKVFPDREIVICPLSPVVGAHSGPKAVSIGYIEQDFN